MTISTEPTQLSYDGDGVTAAFPVTWNYFDKSHVVATLRDSDGIEATWVIGTNYTLTDAGLGSGTLTAITLPATGETLKIDLDPPNTQDKSLPVGGAVPTPQIEEALDIAAQRDAKLESLIGRSIRVQASDSQSGDDLILPVDSERALHYLLFDAVGALGLGDSIPTNATGSYSSLYGLLVTAPQVDGIAVNLESFYSGISGGGGIFYWDSSQDKANANGITIIDTDTLGGWDGTQATIATTYFDATSGQGSGAGSGCWMRGDGILTIESAGVVGDGSVDDTTALTRAANVNRTFGMNPSSTYKITSGVGGASNFRLLGNGATISMAGTISNSTPILSLVNECHVENLTINVATTFTVNRGLVVQDYSTLYNVTVSSTDQQANTADNNHGAIRLIGTGIKADRISVSNWDQTVNAAGVNITINDTRIDTFVRGLYGDVCDFLFVDGVHTETKSANASTSAGHNSVLLSEIRYSSFSNLMLADAGEHALRIGSSTTNASRSLTFSNVQAIRPGQCGFKIQDTGAFRTQDITINGLSVRDGSFGGASSSNEDGLRIMQADGVTVTGFSVMKQENAGTSSYNGIFIEDASYVTITDPTIDDTADSGIKLSDASGALSHIKILSPSISTCAADCVEISSPTEALRNIYITDITATGQTGYAVNVDAGGGITQPVHISGYVDHGGSGAYNSNSTDDQLTVDLNYLQSNFTNNELTIAAAAITLPTRAKISNWWIDTEADAASDTLSTINGGGEGDIIILTAVSNARTVNVDEAGNIRLSSSPHALTHTDDTLMLLKLGANWKELSFSDNET